MLSVATPTPVPPQEVRADLDAALLLAHSTRDHAALVTLYCEAARHSIGTAQAFYLTHAYIFALELGDPRAPTLHDELVNLGADTP